MRGAKRFLPDLDMLTMASVLQLTTARDAVARLRALPVESDRPVLSLFLKLEARDREGGKYGHKLRRRIQWLTARLPQLVPTAAIGAQVREDLAELEDVVAALAETHRDLTGLAVYRSSARDLALAVPLPAVLRSGLVLAPRPVLDGLVLQELATATLRVITLTKRGGRVLMGGPQGLEVELELPPLIDDEAPADRRPQDRDSFEQRQAARLDQGVRRWGETIVALDRVEATALVVPTALVGKVRALWPAALLQRIDRWEPRDPQGLTRQELATFAVAAWEHANAARDAAAVARWQMAGPRQITGPWATLEALLQHRVATVLVDVAAHVESIHDSTTGAWRPPTAHESVEDSMAQDLVDEIIALAVTQGVELLAIQDRAQAAVFDRIGAIARQPR